MAEISLNEQLQQAVVTGDTEKLKELINTGFFKKIISGGLDVDAEDHTQSTPLITAAYYGYPDIIKILLESGADVDAAGEFGNTALMEAAREGYPVAVELLVMVVVKLEVDCNHFAVEADHNYYLGSVDHRNCFGLVGYRIHYCLYC